MLLRSLLMFALFVLLAVAAACGADDSSQGNGAAGSPADVAAPDALAGSAAEQTLTLNTRAIAFDREQLEATAGVVVEILLENRGVLDHDFTIEKLPAEISAVGRQRPDDFDVHGALSRGERARLLLRITLPGEYTFFCAVPGHRRAGMEGSLIVR